MCQKVDGKFKGSYCYFNGAGSPCDKLVSSAQPQIEETEAYARGGDGIMMRFPTWAAFNKIR